MGSESRDARFFAPRRKSAGGNVSYLQKSNPKLSRAIYYSILHVVAKIGLDTTGSEPSLKFAKCCRNLEGLTKLLIFAGDEGYCFQELEGIKKEGQAPSLSRARRRADPLPWMRRTSASAPSSSPVPQALEPHRWKWILRKSKCQNVRHYNMTNMMRNYII